ncbi:MAG: antibiotic biosynthesis monooxygenase [Chloroflexota bacterium]
MFGTIARLQALPGRGEELVAALREDETESIPNGVAFYLYKSEAKADEYWAVAVFTSRETYFANNTPEQDARYRRWRALLVADPEWHDGEVLFSGMGAEQQKAA